MEDVKKSIDELSQPEDSSMIVYDNEPATLRPQLSQHGQALSTTPNQLDDRQAMLDHLSFLEQCALPEGTEAVANYPTNTASLANKMLKEYRDMASKELEVLIPECPQLRVLILGQCGVGKTTLCSKVLGLPEEGVSDRAVQSYGQGVLTK